MSLRTAAIVAGIAYLLNPVTYAEFVLFPRVIVPNDAPATVAHIAADGGSFVAAILCYLVNGVEDIVIAWALYLLLTPVHRALALLTAALRLVYAALALGGVTALAIAYRLVHGPYAQHFPAGELQAQVQLLIYTFRYGWGFDLIVFALHLVLLGYLLYRSAGVLYRPGILPRVIGVLLVLDGIGWIVNPLRPYLYPGANLGWIFPLSFVELALPLWLLIAGWRINGTSTGSAGLVFGGERSTHPSTGSG